MVRTSRASPFALAGALPLAAARVLPAATNLSMQSEIIWVVTGIATGGAIITFAFLAYSLIKFRDPATKGRRYG
ncbi:MAG: hypothetical protein ACREB9_08025 [Thermoplasmata archaeon]